MCLARQAKFIPTALQEVSKNESDLVAKCYYSKKKLVWEVLKNGLKSKIEIQWSDISAIRATLREDQPGVLEIEVLLLLLHPLLLLLLLYTLQFTVDPHFAIDL